MLLRDVARHAGVSTGSVSRALNEPDKVSEKVRSKVLRVIEELGWVPSGAARILASHKTQTIGAIIPTLANVVFAEIMNTVQRHLHANEYILIIGSSEYDPDQAFLQVRKMIERGVDGLILLGENFTPRFWNLLEVQRKPYVVTYSYLSQSQRPSVGCDNFRAFARLTRYLIDLGHRRFGIISQDGSNNDRSEARLQGALGVLDEAGIRVRDEHLRIKEWSIAQGREGMREILANGPRPTAVLCINDQLAIGAMSECQAAGLSIPCDVSITGFDDMELASHVRPSLTTVHIQTELLGIRTAEYLIDTLAGKPVAVRQELEAEVILRESTAPPPATG